MTSKQLAKKSCVPCEGGVAKLAPKEIAKLLKQVPGWELRDETIVTSRTFPDFAQAMVFVDAMAEVAEEEGHHPDFCVHFNRVDVTIWTRAVGGLTENDFIIAAKLDALE